jgi:hypothetical protein
VFRETRKSFFIAVLPRKALVSPITKIRKKVVWRNEKKKSVLFLVTSLVTTLQRGGEGGRQREMIRGDWTSDFRKEKQSN